MQVGNQRMTSEDRRRLEMRFSGSDELPLMQGLKRLLYDAFDETPSPVVPSSASTRPVSPAPASGDRAPCITEKDVKRVLKDISHLFTLPDHVIRIMDILQAPGTTVHQVSNEIMGDPALAAEILRIVNSGFIGLKHRIASIHHAVVILGFHLIQTIVLSVTVVNLTALKPLWNHSLACGQLCSILGRRMGYPRPEDISVAGLLHDIGRIIMAEYLKKEYESVLKLACGEGISGYQAERELLGVSHADIGYWLLNSWNLPAETVVPIGHHHQVKADSPYLLPTAIVHVSDVLVNAVGFQSHEGQRMTPLSPIAMDALHLSMGDLRELIQTLLDTGTPMPPEDE